MIRRKFSASKAEWKYIEELLEAVDTPASPHIRELIENVLVWYVVRAKQYKILEHIIGGITMVTPTIVLLLNQCFPEDLVCGQVVVSIVGTIAASANSFSKIHEKRIAYRKTVEKIKIEIALYINRVGEYSSDNRTEVFVQQICKFQKEEHIEWEKSEKVKEKIKKVEL